MFKIWLIMLFRNSSLFHLIVLDAKTIVFKKLVLCSVVLVGNYCTYIVLVLVIMSVNNNSFS